MLDKVLDKIKKIICTEKFCDMKILIDTNDKLPNNFTLTIVAILMTCAIKVDDKYAYKIYKI